MDKVEHDIADNIALFLMARGDRILCDAGLIQLQILDGALVASLSAKTYEVEIVVSRRIG